MSEKPCKIDWSARCTSPMWKAANHVKNNNPAATPAATRAAFEVSRACTG
jgi:hypothetical protein